MNYNEMFWPLVYAADPVWHYERKAWQGVPRPLPIEEQACNAARDICVESGVLDA